MKVLQDNIMSALLRFPYGIGADDLVAEVYRGAREPEYAKSCIRVAIHRANRTLKGCQIRFSWRKKRYQLWFG